MRPLEREVQAPVISTSQWMPTQQVLLKHFLATLKIEPDCSVPERIRNLNAVLIGWVNLFAERARELFAVDDSADAVRDFCDFQAVVIGHLHRLKHLESELRRQDVGTAHVLHQMSSHIRHSIDGRMRRACLTVEIPYKGQTDLPSDRRTAHHESIQFERTLTQEEITALQTQDISHSGVQAVAG